LLDQRPGSITSWGEARKPRLTVRRFLILFKRFTHRLDGLYVTIAMMTLLLSPAG
jgi:hypothetical protein